MFVFNILQSARWINCKQINILSLFSNTCIYSLYFPFLYLIISLIYLIYFTLREGHALEVSENKDAEENIWAWQRQ
jgi:hypothetical protein